MSRLHQSDGLSILARYTSGAAVVPQQAHEGLMMVIEEPNKSKQQDCELSSLGWVLEKDPTRSIIDFESGREALKRNGFEEQNRVRLMERNRLPSRLPEDWLEFLLTLVLFVGLLSGLVGGLASSWF
ncbi:MAG TPA: hypothetical protein VN957_00265 [Chthoniobacterales bacterium]|nr:hypothetical protein [Chthoniobacterales bacterium]